MVMHEATGPAEPRRAHCIFRRQRPARHLRVEPLEGRALFSSYGASTVPELIAAINSANTSAGADTITLATGKIFSLTAVNNTTNGATGLPTIAAAGGALTIIGNGGVIERSAAAGTPAFRLVDVAAGALLTLKNLTLQGGVAIAWAVPARGGAIYNQGTLNLESVTVQNNTATGSAGIFAWSTLIDGGNAQGGGIYSAGSLSLKDCTIRNNSAIGGRGLDKARYTIQGNEGTGSYQTVYRGSKGGEGTGGGIYVASGIAVIRTSAITGNSAIGGLGDPKGIGSAPGIYIDATASVGLDLFSKRSMKTTDIVGSYHLIT
jgi:hypothetical protein